MVQQVGMTIFCNGLEGKKSIQRISPLLNYNHCHYFVALQKTTKLYSQAAIVAAGNPKAILFFAAIFPQFINSKAAYLPQSCLLLSLASLIAFSCFIFYKISGQKIVGLFSNTAVGKHINRINWWHIYRHCSWYSSGHLG